jgi:hypothetical protein
MRRLLPIAFAVALLTVACSGDDSADADTSTAVAAAAVEPPTTTKAPTTTQATTTTTTQPTTTTTTVPSIENGRYSVPDEVAPDTYRLWYSAARLDENMELIDNYLVGEGDTGIVIVQPTDSYLALDGTMVTVEDFGKPIDPIAKAATGGAYLVGYDLEPGQYRVHPSDNGVAWWKLRDDAMQVTESDEGDASLDVTVQEDDFVLEYRGTLARVP